eukprot:3039064-Alexandrium_andersonii.AAC.1
MSGLREVDGAVSRLTPHTWLGRSTIRSAAHRSQNSAPARIAETDDNDRKCPREGKRTQSET